MALRDRLRGRGPTPDPVASDPGFRDAAAAGWRDADAGTLVPGFDAPPGTTVLDVGCGDTPHSAFFADRDVSLIVADILAESVAAAAARAESVGTWRSVTELVTDTDPLPLPDASVDRVIATEVLEHVPSPSAFMAELVRVGRPGALFLISVPDRRSEHLQGPFAAPDYFAEPNHVRIFDEGEFPALLESAGLVIEHRQLDGFFQSLWWSFFWVCAQPELGPPYQPLLESWMRTWNLLLDCERGPELKRALDERIPKSEVIVARKPT